MTPPIKDKSHPMNFLLQHEDNQVREAARLLHQVKLRRNNMMRLLQEALGDLRLDMKYLMFDLEATRRERDELLEEEDG